jgi:hypothetical protein
MRRFERIGEENRRLKAEAKIDSIINEPEGIAVVLETKPKEDQIRRLLERTVCRRRRWVYQEN